MKMPQVFFVAALLVLSVYVMVVAKAILLPIVVAVVIWHLINTLAKALQSIPLLKAWLAIPLAATLFLAAGWLLVGVISNNFTALSERLPEYQSKLDLLVASIYASVGLGTAPTFAGLLGDLDMTAMAKDMAGSVASLASQMGLILIYVLFLLAEQGTFKRKLSALLSESGETDAHEILVRINKDIQTYIRIKAFLSLLVALVGYGVLLAVGVDFAGFWAVLFFLFNFIPTIGGPLSLLGPALLALLQFDGLAPFAIVTLVIGLMQVAINNLVEPALMGRSLNLSAFVIILALVGFGTIWGVVGMFLCVPILVITMIVLSHFKATRKIAVLLSASGSLRREH